MKKLLILILFTIASTLWMGCDGDMSDSKPNDLFDRSSMLEHWADGFIIPGYESYLNKIISLEEKSQIFVGNPTVDNLTEIRVAYSYAYSAWQEVSMFEIGKAEELSLRNQTNIYPTNVLLITDNVNTGSYNLELPSNIAAQGFPALDYLIHGIAGTDNEILDQYINSSNHKNYLTDLTTRMLTLTRDVYTDWTTGYRETFIADDGSSASSSVNRMVNDYLFYYERFLRAGKIAIPSGVFSGSPLANNVEAFYSDEPINKYLYINSFTAFRQFFEGESKYTGSGPSLAAYLDYIQVLTNGADISGAITTAMNNVETVSADLGNDLNMQVVEDNSKMLATYDALQVITVFMKADMLSALNISVDYVDADGD